jgi:hypothetical protein
MKARPRPLTLLTSCGPSCWPQIPWGLTRHNIPVTAGPQAYALSLLHLETASLWRWAACSDVHSADGAKWTNTARPHQNTAFGATYWRPRLLDAAHRRRDTNAMLRSPDGVQWTMIPRRHGQQRLCGCGVAMTAVMLAAGGSFPHHAFHPWVRRLKMPQTTRRRLSNRSLSQGKLSRNTTCSRRACGVSSDVGTTGARGRPITRP